MSSCWSGRGVPVNVIYKTRRGWILVILMHFIKCQHMDVRIALKIRSCCNLSSIYAPLRIVNHVS